LPREVVFGLVYMLAAYAPGAGERPLRIEGIVEGRHCNILLPRAGGRTAELGPQVCNRRAKSAARNAGLLSARSRVTGLRQLKVASLLGNGCVFVQMVNADRTSFY
jgi:hypothetical protein